MSQVKKALARNILAYRGALAMSKRDLAAKAKMQPRFVTYLESSEANATIEVLERVAKALGVSVAQLVSVEFDATVPTAPKVAETAISLMQAAIDLLKRAGR